MEKRFENALSAALSTGGDFAEFFMEEKKSSAVVYASGRVEDATGGITLGAGLRIFKGNRSVYAHSNDISEAGLMKLARDASASFQGNSAAQIVQGGDPVTAENLHPARETEPGGAKRVDILRRAHDAAKSAYADIRQVSAALNDVEQRVRIVNSEGLDVADTRYRVRFVVQAVASDGAQNQTGMRGPGRSMGYELFDTLVDVEEEARRAAAMAHTMLHAGECPAGVMPVIIGNGFGGVIFHEACGHALEATAIARDASVFGDKLGQKIGSDILSAVDEGVTPGGWGSTNIDDEGMETGTLLLIDKGICRGFMMDRMGARQTGFPRTGSGRRQGYTYAPTSRMRNTYILPGEDSVEAVIGATAEGLYCKAMGGGSVNPLNGEFNFAVLEGYIIKNGKIDRPVRGATLIGRGAEVLERIDRIANDLAMDSGMCGSLSGSVPTAVGQPTIRVSEMTVGGRA